MFNFQEKYKWEFNNYKGMKKESAEEKYIILVNSLIKNIN